MNHDNTFSLMDVAAAGFRLAPHFGRMLVSQRALAKADGEQLASIGRIFETRAEQQPSRPFLLFERKTWSYEQFNGWVNRLAQSFKAKGVRNGDCVALMFENRPELLACVLAANKLGAIAGMLNHHQRGDVLNHSLDLMQPRLVVIGEECFESFDPQRATLEGGVTVFWSGIGQLPAGYADLERDSAERAMHNLPETRQVKLKQKCYYIFTSGTTGMPKAAAMTHLRWYKAGIGMGQLAMRLTRRDIMYCPLPLYHNNALTVALSSVINSGCAIAISRKFSASRFWNDIRTVGATSFIYVGELCRYLLNSPPRQNDRDNRLSVIIGNGMRPDIWEAFQQRFGVRHICEFYGASENNLGFVNLLNLKRTAGFCPMSYAIVRFDPEAESPIRGEGGYLERVEKGGTGLLLCEVSDAVPFDGYTDNQASEAKLLRNVFSPGDTWFNTGDLMRDQGFRHVAFVDRVGDTFRWKGENVATTEVEGVVQRYPGVADAVVYGVQVPHADGRAGMLALTLEPSVAFCLADFYKHVSKSLPAYAVPLFIKLQAQQETTATFKVKKIDLKQQGFRLSGDPVYFLRDRAMGYEPLTTHLHAAIERAEIRF
ncbi:long-chain-acyl-CoA synthetase [Pseudomonas sp. Z18(2022)]|uniref:long-chain-acyl-CoA synthetase n=1 Tax=Pseudomonas sp. Z18(2022) TaxID=2983410 RepID=UPI002E817D25|nr:long-chain-acyl-CoA synthetase [Pseudomonas sp. Z18(2022)]